MRDSYSTVSAEEQQKTKQNKKNKKKKTKKTPEQTVITKRQGETEPWNSLVLREPEKSEIWKFKEKECFKKLITNAKCDRLIEKELTEFDNVEGGIQKYKMMSSTRLLQLVLFE